MKQIKVIDLFAGPGGLGEGFSSLKIKGKHPFKVAVSVEKEASAHATLTLRAFVREFPGRKPPSDYYKYLRGDISLDELYAAYPDEYKAARNETLGGPRELGKDNRLIHAAIKEAIANTKNWVLIGGPPCQAYSLVGRSRNKGKSDYKPEKDARHFLYEEYLEILRKYKPPVFVMENVKGILSSKVKNAHIFEQILQDLKKAGYRIYSFAQAPRKYEDADPGYEPKDFVIRAEDYGIPQTRHRVILLGVRSDIHIDAKDIVLQTSAQVGLKKVIGTLPKLRSGLSKGVDSDELWASVVRERKQWLLRQIDDPKIKREIRKCLQSKSSAGLDRGDRYITAAGTLKGVPADLARFYRDNRLGGVINHESRSHIDLDLARYLYAAAFARTYGKSARLSDFPAKLKPKHANRDSGKFVDRFKVQTASTPASTVTSHISKDGHYFIHYDPEQCRSLTVREAARAQTFPDNYFFEGNRTQQYVQVGNAVPPFLAMSIAKSVHQLL